MIISKRRFGGGRDKVHAAKRAKLATESKRLSEVVEKVKVSWDVAIKLVHAYSKLRSIQEVISTL